MGKKKKSTKAPEIGYDALLDALLAIGQSNSKDSCLIGDKNEEVLTEHGVKLNPTELQWDKSIPVSKQFEGVPFPLGEITEQSSCHGYDENLKRTSEEEIREADRAMHTDIEDARRAAEVHRQVRKSVLNAMRPGMLMTDLCEMVENGTRALVGANGLSAGIAFPTGCSLNHCAAHYTPNPGDNTVLQYGDVCKVDFGVQVNGRIIDSAFTVAFDPKFNPLLEAVRAATNAGIREAGIDVRMGDIGAAIQEVMESYEVELNGKTHVVRPIRNLSGHSIERYKIHAGKSVPIVRKACEPNVKMEEGEFYAIETFGSTGRGWVSDGNDCSHYMRSFETPNSNLIRLPRAKKLLATISREFGSLAFCKRYLERLGEEKFSLPLNMLVEARVVTAYPPLVEIRGAYTAQWEHTIVLRPTCKEVLSRGDDY